MRDSKLIERPVRGWTPWKNGAGEHDIGSLPAFPQAECDLLVRWLGTRRDRALGISPAAMVHEAQAEKLATATRGIQARAGEGAGGEACRRQGRGRSTLPCRLPEAPGCAGRIAGVGRRREQTRAGGRLFLKVADKAARDRHAERADECAKDQRKKRRNLEWLSGQVQRQDRNDRAGGKGNGS